jgi:hypothetical protein
MYVRNAELDRTIRRAQRGVPDGVTGPHDANRRPLPLPVG